MLIKASELTGMPLDWATANAVGWNPVEYRDGMLICSNMPNDNPLAAPSTSWRQGGPLIDKYSIQVSSPFCGSMAHAYVETGTFGGARVMSAKTTLEAICRAVVYHCMGDEVEIPDALLGDY